jgi:cephalosporin-C deacetylase-like acetyl esterase
MHLPGYQSRRKGPGRPGVQQALVFGRQGIADARRARDAVAVLPGIDGRRVSLLGVSLGAILGASAAALDGAFADTFLFLAGGDLRTLYRDGQLEIARLRRAVAEAGMSEAEIFAALDGVDPQALAHRLPKDTTWLWSARQDPVVPAANARALGAAAHLDDQHHIWFPGTHHSGVIQLPDFVRQVALRARNGTPPVAR